MPDARVSIENHYSFDGLVDRIMAALDAAGHDTADTANLTVEERRTSASRFPTSMPRCATQRAPSCLRHIRHRQKCAG
jgi:hypothetical protein